MLCATVGKGYTVGMTEDEAIRVAQDFIRSERIPVGDGIRVVDLERHLAGCEKAASEAAPERIRARAQGRFVVWFEIPHSHDEDITPGEIGVEVDSYTGIAPLVEGCL